MRAWHKLILGGGGPHLPILTACVDRDEVSIKGNDGSGLLVTVGEAQCKSIPLGYERDKSVGQVIDRRDLHLNSSFDPTAMNKDIPLHPGPPSEVIMPVLCHLVLIRWQESVCGMPRWAKLSA
jgi:hypothetical protein